MKRATETIENIEAALATKTDKQAGESDIIATLTGIMNSPLSSTRERLQAAKLLGEYHGLWATQNGEADIEDLTPLSELLKEDRRSKNV